MRKAERLFQIITLLRGRRLAITAKSLAETLEVSERTVYRDIQALILSGVPIEGEAGIGYLLDTKFELPPLMFTSEELLALLVGSKMVQTWGDSALASGANSALTKITAILPEKLKVKSEHSPIVVPDCFRNEENAMLSHVIRSAIEAQNLLEIEYVDAKDKLSNRVIEPLGLVYWGVKWTIVAFCQLRKDYREFRVDRLINCHTLNEHFDVDDCKNLNHYLAIMKDKGMEYTK
jgi:predicted DNA-binding transcriptional regulator YafY